ncbi:MAG: S-layer homology domain-containing protein [Tissierellia bacterium]|nr:S-layer homology domain-containing protein [Tissierellia bacterium]
MFKKTMILTLTFLLVFGGFVYAEKPIPISLEKPVNLTVRDDDGILKPRWTNPSSIIQATKDVNNGDYEYDASLYYMFDWKLNDGDWNICPAPNDPSFNDNIHGPFYLYMPNKQIDEKGNSESFFVIWHLDPTKNASDTFDLKNNTYYFRMRYALESDSNEFTTIYSPYSDVFAIGKNANATEIKKLDPPTNLKVEVKKDSSNKPYFHLNWTIPQSITEASKHLPVFHRIDFKVGDGKWASEMEFDSMAIAGSKLLTSSDTLDPVEKNYVDKVVIEENTYYFRILFEGEPSTGNSIYSGFSNIVSTKVESYSNASNWAKPELEKAADYGLIPASLKGADMTKPITREEFAEVTIKLYEKTTGFTPYVTVPNPFTDTKNPEILKAYQIGITAGTSATTFEPNKLINREQVASMLSRAIRIMVPTADFSTDGAPTFKDEKDISIWALEHVKYMSKIGIIKGTDESFMPKAITSAQIAEGYANTTREQAIAMGVRAFEKYKNGN